jgi:hypothetical protein
MPFETTTLLSWENIFTHPVYTELLKMFCPGGTAFMTYDIDIEFYTKWKPIESGI